MGLSVKKIGNKTLRTHLDTIPREQLSGEGVLIPDVKKATGLDEVSRKVWRTIVERALDGSEYEVEGMRFKLVA